MLLVASSSRTERGWLRLLLLCTSRSDIPYRRALNSQCRIHNEYMLTSSWKIVYYFIRDIRGIDLIDSMIRTQLSSDEWLRMRYLALYDIVDNLTSLYHARLSLLATTSRELESSGDVVSWIQRFLVFTYSYGVFVSAFRKILHAKHPS